MSFESVPFESRFDFVLVSSVCNSDWAGYGVRVVGVVMLVSAMGAIAFPVFAV